MSKTSHCKAHTDWTQMKSNKQSIDWPVDSFKKYVTLIGSTPEPMIQLCDTRKRMPHFDSCQLTLILLTYIKSLKAEIDWTELYLQ